MLRKAIGSKAVCASIGGGGGEIGGTRGKSEEEDNLRFRGKRTEKKSIERKPQKRKKKGKASLSGV